MLDTHVFLWWLADDPRLPAKISKAIADSRSQVFVSAVVIWEISIKKALGKLQCPDNIEEAIRVNGFHSLDITISHALELQKLPIHHNDPFDRMLIAQAQFEKLTIATHDSQIKKYGVPLLHA